MHAIRRASAALALMVFATPALHAAMPQNVDFERHVMGLFSKTGCNAGSCHGSFQGKNGFRLSLFGYDPSKDFAALTRDQLGRRIDPVDPDRSLLLLKATGQAPHEGGARVAKGSWQYEVFRSWIVAGAPWKAGSGTVADLHLDADASLFVKPGEVRPVAVTARFADGSEEVVTRFCDFRTQDDTVAEVTGLGVVKALRPGDTGLVVSYRGTVRAVRVLVPAPAVAGLPFPSVPEANFIDREVFAKLRSLNMVPSSPANDNEFLRRVTIDTIGSLPSPDDVRAFLADPSPDKRAHKIEQLLAHPLHAALWATKLSDITGNNTDALEQPQQLKAKRSQQWQDWLRKRLAENVPYDQIVKGILTATSREGMPAKEWVDAVVKQDETLESGFDYTYQDRQTLDLFWRRQGNVQLEQWGEKVAAAFLGVRLECAQCHKHPTDRWTQTDYRSFANLFAQVNFGGLSPEVRSLALPINDERKAKSDAKNMNRLNLIKEMYLGQGGTPQGKGNGGKIRPVKALTHPETGQPLTPKTLGGPELPIKPGEDVRASLFEWMRSPENPYFARSFVNRVWAHYFGVGLVEPVDDFSVANPPTNAKLLDALARDFVEHQYDLRHLERTILATRAYQTSAVPNASNKFDKNNFARAYVRPMMAEAVVDVLNAALGTGEKFGPEAPSGSAMVEVGASRFLANGNLSYALRIFGRPARTTACDCERTLDPALPQTLYRMTDTEVLRKLTDPSGRLSKLLKSGKSDSAIIDELFLATLTRLPSEAEKSAYAHHRDREKNRAAALQDTLWALINTREFILNH